MTDRPQDIAALLGSRICHDLISPLGAIGNGLELIAMSGAADGPEMSLINESVSNAKARIRFYRVAFGAPALDQCIARTEVASILDDVTAGTRLRVTLDSSNEIMRGDAKLLFLLIQCCESAMPFGGVITIARDGPAWTVAGTAGKLRIDRGLWAMLSGPQLDAAEQVEVSPARVHFALVAPTLEDIGKHLSVQTGEGAINMRVVPTAS